MAYEYNPDSARFEVPNPHRLENTFLLLAATACLGCAVAALLRGRAVLEGGINPAALVPIVISALLLGFGMSFGHAALKQLRFFFGRNNPQGLAQELSKDSEGSSEGAEQLRETLRQNAITYPTPTGAIDNLLYTLSRDLIFAPQRTQVVAMEEFHNVLVLSFLLTCLIVSTLGVSSEQLQDWISLLYFALLNALVLLPSRRTGLSARRLSTAMIIVLIIVATLTPVVLPHIVGHRVMPFANAIEIPNVTFGILSASLVAAALLLMAALAQQVKPKRIAMAQNLQTLSMNAPPNQIFLEFNREMQRGWTESIPNRVYMRWQPRTEDNNGSFEGHQIEETQPVPQDTEPLSIARCLRLTAYRWLLFVDLFALALASFGAWQLLQFSRSPAAYGTLLIGSSLLLIARFAFQGGNRLWRRFEFISKIYWLECQGNYTRAKASVGALLQDRIHTEKDLVNVEDMTLRVWVAEIDSVSYGPDMGRSLMSIRGLPKEAQLLAESLAQFGRQQASLVSPQADNDLHRLAVLQKISPVANGAAGDKSLDSFLPNPDIAPPRYCSHCGKPVTSNARFCSACGGELANPTAVQSPSD